MTAAFGQTNFPTQDPTTYKSLIDANFAVLARLGDAFAPHAQAVPNMTVQIDPGVIFDGVNLNNIGAQTTAIFTASVSNPRIDRIVYDAVTGIVSVIAGSESASPVPPGIPAGQMPVAQVALTVGVMSIVPTAITDERATGTGPSGGFGPRYTIASAATVDLGAIASHNILITGTTGITSFGSDASTSRPFYMVTFGGALTLTNGANLVLPAGANLAVSSGDCALLEYVGAGVWYLRHHYRIAGRAPTRTYLYSGSGNYTAPLGCTSVSGRLRGGGGGGGGSATAGSAGSATTFNGISAAGGAGGAASGSSGTSPTPAAGGTSTGSGFRIPGQPGAFGWVVAPAGAAGLNGGGGGPSGSGSAANAAGNTGAGGGAGAATDTSHFSASTGAAGEEVQISITNPTGSYSYSIGAGGAGATTGNTYTGGNGGSGVIIIDEFYT